MRLPPARPWARQGASPGVAGSASALELEEGSDLLGNLLRKVKSFDPLGEEWGLLGAANSPEQNPSLCSSPHWSSQGNWKIWKKGKQPIPILSKQHPPEAPASLGCLDLPTLISHLLNSSINQQTRSKSSLLCVYTGGYHSTHTKRP